MTASSDYIESAADHSMTAFLASMTIRKAFRDLPVPKSLEERKRVTYIRERADLETSEERREQIAVARQMAELMNWKAS